MREAPSFANVLGALALALGIGVVGAYALDLHAHTCDHCSHRWHHLGAFNAGDEAAHACPQCGVTQWWKDGPWAKPPIAAHAAPTIPITPHR